MEISQWIWIIALIITLGFGATQLSIMFKLGRQSAEIAALTKTVETLNKFFEKQMDQSTKLIEQNTLVLMKLQCNYPEEK